MNAGVLIKTTRERHRLGQDELACRARTSQSLISRIENGHVSPTIETLDRLLAVMGEQVVADVRPLGRGNSSTAALRADYEQKTAAERVQEAMALSYTLTSIAAAARSTTPSTTTDA